MRERAGKKKSRIETWLKSASTPVFLMSANRRVVFFNQGCELLTGWKADDVVGEIAEFTTDADAASMRSIINALCPPATVFAGQEQDVPTFLPQRTGSSLAKLIRFIPIRDDTDRVRSVLGLILPLPAQPPAQPPPLALKYHAELSALRWSLRQRFGMRTVIARSPVMRRVSKQLELARQSSCPVHFVGPRGSGKEHLARAVHLESDSQQGSFVPLDCASSPFEVLQTLKRVLHPQEDDSPKGALQPRTVFLCNVGQLSRDAQERLVEAYGSESSSRRTPLPRLMSSATEPLSNAELEERLLPDVFYLLTTLTIEVPPLRDRLDDLPLLAQAFLESLNRGASRQMSGFTDAVWPALREYQWPGNLDELALVVAEARENGAGLTIDLSNLPLRFRAGLDAQSIGPAQPLPGEVPFPNLPEHLEEIERDWITRALSKAKGNKTLAATLLSIPRPVLYRRMQALKMLDPQSPSTE